MIFSAKKNGIRTLVLYYILSALSKVWIEQRVSRFKAACDALYEKSVNAPNPYFFNWYEKVANVAQARADSDGEKRGLVVALSDKRI